ncbi:MAG: beta-Ala-His dipeptidase [Deltaproteobacteria bacterium]|nr:beta-Ala-His dipeptidase [Deltaproteobacteria bacterium]
MNKNSLPSALAGLEPEEVWRYFAAIAAIPHGSGNESLLADYVCRLAAAAGFACKRDSAGNVCLYVPPSPGCEHAPVVVLQGHLDMVCEKNDDLDFDFMRSGIQLVQDSGWIRANGTTLGADNGIGMAAALAAAFSSGIERGPLEILLTADEERGLKGAMDFDPSWLSGRILLNLDSEKTGAVCIGCAGGGRVTVRLPISCEPVPAAHAAIAVRISGLRGGHSGLNIHENRGNAIKLLAALLNTVRSMDISLCSLTGGDKHNAIPREAAAVLSLPWSQIEQLRIRLDTAYGALARGCPQEPAMMMSITEIDPQQKAAPCSNFSRMLDLLQALPSGVLAMSTDIPGLVETSCNLAAARMQGSMLYIDLMPRSSHIAGLDTVTGQIQAIAGLAGGDCSSEKPYPGWEPRLNSPVLHCVETVHQKLFGVKPHLEATHAGLECGIIGEKCSGMDMLSFGPDIVDCHSPAEKVLIASVEKFWLLLCGVLENIAKM